jgi:hypothetical protein
MSRMLPLLLLGCTSLAIGVRVAWDPNPPAERVGHYQLRGNNATTDVSEATAIVEVIPGTPLRLQVVAINYAGAVSDPSDELVLRAHAWSATLQESDDLGTWRDTTNNMAWSTITTDRSKFFRAVIREIP